MAVATYLFGCGLERILQYDASVPRTQYMHCVAIVLHQRWHVMTRRCIRSGEGEMTFREILREYLESKQL